VGYGKANQVPPAIEKAQKDAKRRLQRFPLVGRTIPHEVTGRYGSCTVRMIPASPGTGVIAGAAVRAPLEVLGLQDCLTKSFGSNNSKNLVKAVIDGLGPTWLGIVGASLMLTAAVAVFAVRTTVAPTADPAEAVLEPR